MWLLFDQSESIYHVSRKKNSLHPYLQPPPLVVHTCSSYFALYVCLWRVFSEPRGQKSQFHSRTCDIHNQMSSVSFSWRFNHHHLLFWFFACWVRCYVCSAGDETSGGKIRSEVTVWSAKVEILLLWCFPAGHDVPIWL